MVWLSHRLITRCIHASHGRARNAQRFLKSAEPKKVTVGILYTLKTSQSRIAAAALGAAGLVLGATSARALPSFARQMDMQCVACHTDFPILNDMGRTFKLSGYTMSAEQTDLP